MESKFSKLPWITSKFKQESGEWWYFLNPKMESKLSSVPNIPNHSISLFLIFLKEIGRNSKKKKLLSRKLKLKFLLRKLFMLVTLENQVPSIRQINFFLESTENKIWQKGFKHIIQKLKKEILKLAAFWEKHMKKDFF